MNQLETQINGYRIDDVYIDAVNRRLWRDGRLLQLSSRYFDVLLMLVGRRGKLVQKEHIFREVWDGVSVTDSALTQCIKDIRKSLGDDVSNPRYIKTVPKHGYMFIGDAVESSGAEIDTVQAPVARTSRPYKFLDYYSEGDKGLFFGREQEIETICSQVLAHRTFILHGRSGVGKSSILRAGLMPRLRSEGHLVFAVRSFTDPVYQMEVALSEVSGLSSSSGQERPLADHLEQIVELYPNLSVIFFLDQFEEFFSILPDGSKIRFIATLSEFYAHEATPLRLVFALREDLLAEMSRFKSAFPDIFHHEYRLERLNRKQAELSIVRPAEAIGCRYERDLIDRLLDDLNDGGGVDPPQLQIVCDRLYDLRSANGNLTSSAYEELGTASRILRGYLERVLNRFSAADLYLAKEILKALISSDGERLVLRVVELNARVGGSVSNGSTAIDDLIEEMVAARVVRRRSQEGEGWVELAHDFLIPEIWRWLTVEDGGLKRARGVIERAMENYQAHELILDFDALDLLLPFGERLGLTGPEADFLTISLLKRGRPLPDWLVRISPSASSTIYQALVHPHTDMRLAAAQSCRLLPDTEVKEPLRRAALWDKVLKVRKAASIALADKFGGESRELLSKSPAQEKVGPIRRALGMAMLRDHDESLVRLLDYSLPVNFLIVLALAWVRLKRARHKVLSRGLGGMLGGASSGMVGGLILGTVLTMARPAGGFEAASLILVLIVLGITAGSIGGFGVSFGMTAAAQITYRHSKWWALAGSALGGAAIGGSTKFISLYTLRALFGGIPTEVTGAFEGAFIGAGLVLGALLADQLSFEPKPWRRIIGAGLGTMAACVILALLGRNLFSGSIELVARSFVDSQIKMDPLASFFGELYFGRTTQIALGTIEGLMFGGWTMAGMEFFSRTRRKD